MFIEILKRIPGYFASFIFVFILSSFFIIALMQNVFFFKKDNLKNNHPGTIIIEKGEPLHSIVSKLKLYGFVANEKLFSIALRLMTVDKLLQAGEYKITPSTNTLSLLGKMIGGETVNHYFFVPPGSSSCQILQKLSENKYLTGDLPSDLSEGELLADTYYFKLGETKISLINRIKKLSYDFYTQTWEKYNSAYSKHKSVSDAIIVASLIQKEALKKDDYKSVSDSINERLKRNMRLQLDSTVVYAMTYGCNPLGRRLMQNDRKIKSPFNTYINWGLPPIPIANPSQGAFKAAITPKETDKIYFLLYNDASYFSSSYKEHLYNKKDTENTGKKK